SGSRARSWSLLHGLDGIAGGTGALPARVRGEVTLVVLHRLGSSPFITERLGEAHESVTVLRIYRKCGLEARRGLLVLGEIQIAQPAPGEGVGVLRRRLEHAPVDLE